MAADDGLCTFKRLQRKADMPDPNSGTITLTRDEAVEVVREMRFTGPGYCLIDNPRSRAETDALIDRMRLEAAVRDAGGWWGDGDPGVMREHGTAPESFELAASGLPAFAELLPELRKNVASVLIDCARHYHMRGEAAGVHEELRLLDGIRDRLDGELVAA